MKNVSANGAYADFANKVARAATVPNPKRRYVRGFMAKPLIAIRQWLGDGVCQGLIMSQVK